MAIPRRIQRLTGRKSLVDGIPFTLPVESKDSPALMAAFLADADRAREVLPGNELHPLLFRGKAILIVAVIDYRHTNIGKYIEYSIGLGCSFGEKPTALPLAALLRGRFGTGQYVVDLPVSTEISVKGGKGIWGMPKHQANLDFEIADQTVRSRYDKDGQMVAEIEIVRPARSNFPVSTSAVNWCSYRGLLMKSSIYFSARGGFNLFGKASATLRLGDSPRADLLRRLEIQPSPIFTAFFPESAGALDDHFESWFLSFEQMPGVKPEGFESVIDLGLGEEWLAPPGSTEPADSTAGREDT